MIRTLIVIGLGGFLGSISRYLLTAGIHQYLFTSFPAGTLAVNSLGSLLIGIIYGFAEKGALLNADWKLFLTVGFCGGFTTFSTFSHDNLMLLRDGQTTHFLLYTLGSILLGLLAVVLGYLFTKTL